MTWHRAQFAMQPLRGTSGMNRTAIKHLDTKKDPSMKKDPFLVGREGFEPPKAEPADLQSAPFGHLGTCPNFSDHYTHLSEIVNLQAGLCLPRRIVQSR